MNRSVFITIYCLLSYNFLDSQTWQFTKPYYELSNEYNAGKIKQLRSGNLVRVFADTYRTIIHGYDAAGDSLWYHKIENLYINELCAVGDSVYFCGWFKGQIQVGSQSLSSGDSLYGIYGIIDQDGIIKNVNKLTGINVRARSISVMGNSVCIGGGFDQSLSTSVATYTDSVGGVAFVLLLDNALNQLACERSWGGYASIMQCRIDHKGDIVLLSDAAHFLKWRNRYLSHPDSGSCGSGGQLIFKITSTFDFLWKDNIYSGIGPGYYLPCLLVDSLNHPAIYSHWHWGSGASSSMDIRVYNPDGTQYWSKSLGTNKFPLLGQDKHGNYYAIAGKPYFTLYKFTNSGAQLYYRIDSTWSHQIHYWDLAGEDQFYGLGVCVGNNFDCKSNLRYLTYFADGKPVGMTETFLPEENISVYPNPSSGQITVQMDMPRVIYRVINSSGGIISEGVVTRGRSTLNLSGISKGVYLLQIQNKDMLQRRKFLID